MCPNFKGRETRAEFKLEIMEVFRAAKQRQYLKTKSATALLEEIEEEMSSENTIFNVQLNTDDIPETEDFDASYKSD